MSDLPKMLKKLKYDKRMMNWNLRQKLLTEEEYAKHLSQLEDLSHLVQTDKKEDEKNDNQEDQNQP